MKYSHSKEMYYSQSIYLYMSWLECITYQKVSVLMMNILFYSCLFIFCQFSSVNHLACLISFLFNFLNAYITYASLFHWRLMHFYCTVNALTPSRPSLLYIHNQVSLPSKRLWLFVPSATVSHYPSALPSISLCLFHLPHPQCAFSTSPQWHSRKAI